MIKNLNAILQRIDIFVDRYDRHTTAYFRACVWDLFQEIVVQTPQYTGQAAANWNIGIDQPDYTFRPFGEAPGLTPSGLLSRAGIARTEGAAGIMRGHPAAVLAALERNLPIVKRIEKKTRVFITNAARGDTDHGRSSELYLESLQDPGYWSVKLRAVNKPYETAAETILRFNQEKIAEGKVAVFL